MRLRTAWLEASMAVGIALWLTPAACAAEISSGVLDDAESNICRARAGLEHALAAAAETRHQSIPVEQLADQRIADPVARARMQHELDARLLAAQDEIVENDRRDLDRYQDEYRRLTGSSFDAAACNGAQTRVTHAATEQQRKQDAANASLSRAMAFQEAAAARWQADARVSDACEAKRVLDIPPAAAARLFPAGQVDKSRRVYDEFASSYQREHGVPFDPARCR